MEKKLIAHQELCQEGVAEQGDLQFAQNTRTCLTDVLSLASQSQVVRPAQCHNMLNTNAWLVGWAVVKQVFVLNTQRQKLSAAI